MDPKTKTFDAVEMSRELRETTSRLLESMSREERKETFRRARAQYEIEHAAYLLKLKQQLTTAS